MLYNKIKSDLQSMLDNKDSYKSISGNNKLFILKAIMMELENEISKLTSVYGEKVDLTDKQVLEILERLEKFEEQRIAETKSYASGTLKVINSYLPELTEDDIKQWILKNFDWFIKRYDISEPGSLPKIIESVSSLIFCERGKKTDTKKVEKAVLSFKEDTNMRVFMNILNETVYKLNLFKSKNEMIVDFESMLKKYLHKWNLKQN